MAQRVVQRARPHRGHPGLNPALDPGISAYLEAVRDYLVVADTSGTGSGPLRGRPLAARRRPRAPHRAPRFAALPQAVRHASIWRPPVGAGALLRHASGNAGPEIGGVLVATSTRQVAFGPAAAPAVDALHRSHRPHRLGAHRATGSRARVSGRCRGSWTRWRRSRTGGASTGGSRCRFPATRWRGSRSRSTECWRVSSGASTVSIGLPPMRATSSRRRCRCSGVGVERALVHPGVPQEILEVARRDAGPDQPDDGDGGEPADPRPGGRGGRAARDGAVGSPRDPQRRGGDGRACSGESTGVRVTSEMPRRAGHDGGGPPPDPGDAAQPRDQRRQVHAAGRHRRRSRWPRRMTRVDLRCAIPASASRPVIYLTSSTDSGAPTPRAPAPASGPAPAWGSRSRSGSRKRTADRLRCRAGRAGARCSVCDFPGGRASPLLTSRRIGDSSSQSESVRAQSAWSLLIPLSWNCHLQAKAPLPARGSFLPR